MVLVAEFTIKFPSRQWSAVSVAPYLILCHYHEIFLAFWSSYFASLFQGIIDPAFSKPRIPMPPCFCLQIPPAFQQRSSPPIANGMLPPAAKPGKGKCTTAAMLLDMVKDVEIAISCRKGRTGTAAGDVAFPKGKENLASVLKRYKRRLSNKPVGTQEVSSTPRKQSVSSVSFSS